MKIKEAVLNPGDHCVGTSLGLLILRVVPGVMMLAHGWGKLASFNSMIGKFPDPIGLGSTTSLALTVFAEFFCAAAVVLGLGTRAAAIPLLITMLVAGFVVHGGDPFAKKELALLFAAVFATLPLTGAGRYSVDAKLGGRKGASAKPDRQR